MAKLPRIKTIVSREQTLEDQCWRRCLTYSSSMSFVAQCSLPWFIDWITHNPGSWLACVASQIAQIVLAGCLIAEVRVVSWSGCSWIAHMEMHLFASVLDQFLYSTSSRDPAKTLPSVLNNFVTLVQTLWEAYLLATGAHSFFLIFFYHSSF